MDIVCLLFACVAVNHLGLVDAVGRVIGRSLPVVSCPKCLTFWTVLVYGCVTGLPHGVAAWLALSLLCSWSAIWLDLGMAAVDALYLRAYEIINTHAHSPSADAVAADKHDALPRVRAPRSEADKEAKQ